MNEVYSRGLDTKMQHMPKLLVIFLHLLLQYQPCKCKVLFNLFTLSLIIRLISHLIYYLLSQLMCCLLSGYSISHTIFVWY